MPELQPWAASTALLQEVQAAEDAKSQMQSQLMRFVSADKPALQLATDPSAAGEPAAAQRSLGFKQSSWIAALEREVETGQVREA